MNRLTITLIYIFLSACADQQEQKKPESQLVAEEPPGCPQEDAVGVTQWKNGVGVTPSANQENERWLNKQNVQKKYACEKNPLPYVVIERNQLIPANPQAGQAFRHCFIYTVCDSDPSAKTIKVTLNRKAFLKKNGKVLFQDDSPEVVTKPGRWTDVARITPPPPPKTKPGFYIFQLSISLKDSKIVRDFAFEIK